MAAPLVLVVDDDPSQGRKSCTLLRAAGFDCVTTMTTEGTLTLLEHGLRPAVVALDLMMPGDGNKLATSLREIDPSMPIIVITGWPQILQPEVAGIVSAVVEKPIDGTQLLNAIRSAVGEKC